MSSAAAAPPQSSRDKPKKPLPSSRAKTKAKEVKAVQKIDGTARGATSSRGAPTASPNAAPAAPPGTDATADGESKSPVKAGSKKIKHMAVTPQKSDIEEKLEETVAQFKELQTNRDTLQQKNQELTKFKEGAERTKKAAEETVKALSMQLEEAQVRIKELEEAQAPLQAQVTQLQGEKEAAETALAPLREEVAALQATAESTKRLSSTQADALTSQLHSEKLAIEKVNERVVALEQENAALRATAGDAAPAAAPPPADAPVAIIKIVVDTPAAPAAAVPAAAPEASPAPAPEAATAAPAASTPTTAALVEMEPVEIDPVFGLEMKYSRELAAMRIQARRYMYTRYTHCTRYTRCTLYPGRDAPPDTPCTCRIAARLSHVSHAHRLVRL